MMISSRSHVSRVAIVRSWIAMTAEQPIVVTGATGFIAKHVIGALLKRGKTTPGAPELAVINPAFVQGPALDGDLSTSHELYRLMARGVYPAAPRIRFPVVDVRDVAEAHVEAAFRPQAAGKRYLVGEGQLRLFELGQILARELPDLRSKVPKFELPDVAVRMLALFDKRLRTILPELGEQKDYTNATVQTDLGLHLKGADEAVTAAVRSLRDLRLI